MDLKKVVGSILFSIVQKTGFQKCNLGVFVSKVQKSKNSTKNVPVHLRQSEQVPIQIKSLENVHWKYVYGN